MTIFPTKWRANEQQGGGWAPTRRVQIYIYDILCIYSFAYTYLLYTQMIYILFRTYCTIIRMSPAFGLNQLIKILKFGKIIWPPTPLRWIRCQDEGKSPFRYNKNQQKRHKQQQATEQLCSQFVFKLSVNLPKPQDMETLVFWPLEQCLLCHLVVVFFYGLLCNSIVIV